MDTRIPPEEAAKMAAGLSGWTLDSGGTSISKDFALPDFASALALANRIGAAAERQGHHPDLEVSWGKLRVTLSTHDVGGLSQKDFALAAAIVAL